MTRDLDTLYATLLYHGLVAIRNASFAEDLERCQAESEYLHEVPSLIGETNVRRHVYQATAVRAAYLRWAAKDGRDDVREFVEVWYAPLWRQMDSILGGWPAGPA